MVAKFEMPKINDLELGTFTFHLTCEHLSDPKSYVHKYFKHCKKIEYYNQTAYKILEKEINLILPNYINIRRNKRFIGAILGGIASSVISLAFERISSFLHHKRHKTFTKAMKVMKDKADLESNRVYHLEDTMIMYGKYNSDTLMDV